MSLWMFRCSDIAEKVSMSMDEPLPLKERIAVRLHLMLCRYCSRFDRQVRQLREMSRTHGPSEPETALSPEAKARIRKAINSLA